MEAILINAPVGGLAPYVSAARKGMGPLMEMLDSEQLEAALDECSTEDSITAVPVVVRERQGEEELITTAPFEKAVGEKFLCIAMISVSVTALQEGQQELEEVTGDPDPTSQGDPEPATDPEPQTAPDEPQGDPEPENNGGEEPSGGEVPAP